MTVRSIEREVDADEASASKAEASSKRKTYSAPALEKGLDILELLAREQDGLNIGEIVTRLKRSVGELFRMLVVLEQRGYVCLPEGSDKYTLTLRMFAMVHQFPPVKRLTSIAGAVLQRLAYNIEQSCHLVIYYEGRGHVVVQQDSPSVRVFSVRLGAEASLLDTCSGHVLLAFATDVQREQMLKRTATLNKTELDGINKIIKRVKRQGYESIQSAQAHGVEDIGFPVFDYTDNVVAVLIVPFFAYLDGSHPMGVDEARTYVQAAAQEISTSLGYQLP